MCKCCLYTLRAGGGFVTASLAGFTERALIVSKTNIWVSSSIVDFVVELEAIAAFLVGYGGGGV